MQQCTNQWQQQCGNWQEQMKNWQQQCGNWQELMQQRCKNWQEQCGNWQGQWQEQCGNLQEQCGNLQQQCNNGWQEMNQKFWTLHRLSLTYLESLDKNVIQKGKETILKMLEIIPNHKIALYNLACAESLLGNVKEAVAALEKAINAGYSDLTHILKDKDLNNIKETVGFNNLMERLKLRSSNPPSPSTEDPIKEKVEEKVEKKEEKIEEKKEVNPLEEKVNILAEIFPLPKDILQELLTQCQDSVEKVVDLINSTTF
jgi:tetratricopeptide (TPR) repeat protein